MSGVSKWMGHTCPACGYDGLNQRPYAQMPSLPVPDEILPPYEEVLGEPSYEVCDCCGFEFGNDGNPGTGTPVSFGQYRTEWLGSGATWFNPIKRPPSWSVESQLQNLHLAAD